MEFNLFTKILIGCCIIFGIWCILDTTRSINERYDQGINVTNGFWRKICFLYKPPEKHISFVSAVFLAIGYAYAFIGFSCLLPLVLVFPNLADFLLLVCMVVVWITLVVERIFLPPYGTRGR